MNLKKIILFCFVFLINNLIFSKLIFSKYISLSLSTTVQKIDLQDSDIKWNISLVIKNSGNDTAFNVYPDMIIKNKFYQCSKVEHYNLSPNTQNKWNFIVYKRDFDLTDDSLINNGIYPIEFYINYKDSNGKGYSITNIDQINTGSYKKSKLNMKLSTQNISIKSNNDIKKTKITINNFSNTEKEYSFYAISPTSIKLFIFSEFSDSITRISYLINDQERTYYNFSLLPKEKMEIPIKIKNLTNNPPSSLFIYYVLIEKTNSIDTFNYLAQRVDITDNKLIKINLLPPLIVILIVTFLVLLFIIIFSVIFYKKPKI